MGCRSRLSNLPPRRLLLPRKPPAGREESMPQSFMVFDFGTNEDAAQQARHRLEGWRQAFRLADRVKFKFERIAPEPAPEPPKEAAKEAGAKKKTKAKATKGKSTKKKKEEAAATPPEPPKEPAAPPDHVRLLVRLDFPGHEKLTYQRWFDRIPAEPPFQATEKQVFRPGQDNFEATEELFDSLA
jgi:hypothetical protein